MAPGGGFNNPYGNAILERLMGLRSANVSANPNIMFPDQELQGGPDPSQNVFGNLMDIFPNFSGTPYTPDAGPVTGVDNTFSPIQSISPPGGNTNPGYIQPSNGGAPPSTTSIIKSPTGNYRRTGTPAARKGSSNIGSVSATLGGPRRSAITARLQARSR